MKISLINKLSDIVGITSSYIDKMGKKHITPIKLKQHFLNSIGYNFSSDSDLKKIIENEENKVWLNGFDFVNSFFDNEKFELDFYVQETLFNQSIKFFINKNNRCIQKGSLSIDKILDSKIINKRKYIHTKITLPIKLKPDYYDLIFRVNNNSFSTFLIIAPQSAYLTKGILKQKKYTGIGLQLYALKSHNNMGIGDLGDLETFIKIIKSNNCDFIGINPLSAMMAKSKDDVSPYRVLSREYLNYIYLDLKHCPDFSKSKQIQRIIHSQSYKEEIKSLQENKFVDYYKIFDLKLSLLKLMYKQFKKEIKKNSKRAKLFLKFKIAEKTSLQNLCVFESLFETQSDYWKFWGELSDINSPALKKYIKTHKKLIDFYAYCHWLTHLQLLSVKKKASKLSLGLYLDMPVGAASNGVEVWSLPYLFADNVDIGAPPDTIRPKGQSWGLSPLNPIALKETRYKHFINLLNHNMRYANMIRLDHSFSLMRLFWVDMQHNGAYINYNFKDMTAILCLESIKNKCMVIGEDLGNVPNGFREMMAKHNIFSNKILFRQKDKDGAFLSVKKYPYYSLSQVSTHDQATSCGFWLNEDIKMNNSCGLYPKHIYYLDNLQTRQTERENFVKVLKKTQIVLDSSFDGCITGNCIPENLSISFNLYGAKTNSALFMIRIEDIFNQIAMQNVPGTVNSYPNWRTKLPIFLEEISKTTRLKSFMKSIASVRKKGS